MPPIYLDYNATTPIDPAVAEAMQPYIAKHYGNPSSAHEYGRSTKNAVERARQQVAALLGCTPEEIIFTSGGSESNNTVLKGVAYTYRHQGKHLITSAVEHPAIINPCRFLEQQGIEVSYLPVDRTGMVDPADVRQAITPQTILISIMHANNEVGTLQPIVEISRIAREHGVLMHTDAAQSVGKIPTEVDELGVDFLSIAGHKVYAPKGIGALYIRAGVALEPLIHGAGHEFGRRAGTENVIFDVSLGRACEVAKADLPRYQREVRQLRDFFQEELAKRFGKRVVVNGHPEERLPNTLHVNFRGVIGAELLEKLPELAASTGSACHAGEIALSSVLEAMQVAPELGMGAVRFSLGRYTTRQEIERAVELIERAY
ncbi:MAG TPA: cysteine desulfurase family protein [Candidatus Tectomicrobia bacterium]|nr:cysteine desulfurase family protein [Candidatus Tectomicrobia bacterium]